MQWGVMTALVLATAALGWLFRQTIRTEVPVRQLTIPLENGTLPGAAGARFPFWSPDSRYFAYTVETTDGSDISIVPTDPATEPLPFMKTASSEWDPAFSPDGRRIFYLDNTDQICVVDVEPSAQV
jgi:hypothetical protein